MLKTIKRTSSRILLAAKATTLTLLGAWATTLPAQPTTTDTAPSATLQFKPGLWAIATNGTFNGGRLPTILDPQATMPPSQRQAMAGVMRQAGLPAGWSPYLECSRGKVALDLAAIKGIEGCQATATHSSATSASFDLVCRGQISGKGQGTVTILSDTSAEGRWMLDGGVMSLPVRMSQSMQARWLGKDCSQLPPGIDPAWVKRR
ncbi:MAG: DUF3617 family protein [Pseudomonadota bacterium]